MKTATNANWIITATGTSAWDWNSDNRVQFTTDFTADDFIAQGHIIASDDRKCGNANVWN